MQLDKGKEDDSHASGSTCSLSSSLSGDLKEFKEVAKLTAALLDDEAEDDPTKEGTAARLKLSAAWKALSMLN